MEIEPLKFVIKFVKLLSGRNRLWFPWKFSNLSFPLSPLTGSPARILHNFTHFKFYDTFSTAIQTILCIKYFLEFLTRHGISSGAAQARGKKVGQTGGDFHGELSNELFLMSWAGLAPQSIWSRYPECPSSDWSREWKLFSPLSLQTINIDNLSQEKDRSQSGSLHVDQVAEIFRVYEVKTTNTRCLENIVLC